jgi:hypothetical protein
MADTDCDIAVKAYLANRYSYLSDNDKESVLGKAKMFYFKRRYPCQPDASEADRPITGNNIFWIELACDEIISKLGIEGITAYQENSISLRYGNAQLSQDLLNMLTPEAGVIDLSVLNISN